VNWWSYVILIVAVRFFLRHSVITIIPVGGLRRFMACPWNLGQESFKVIENGTIQQIIYDFLPVCHYRYHFRVIWRWRISWTWNLGCGGSFAVQIHVRSVHSWNLQTWRYLLPLLCRSIFIHFYTASPGKGICVRSRSLKVIEIGRLPVDYMTSIVYIFHYIFHCNCLSLSFPRYNDLLVENQQLCCCQSSAFAMHGQNINLPVCVCPSHFLSTRLQVRPP